MPRRLRGTVVGQGRLPMGRDEACGGVCASSHVSAGHPSKPGLRDGDEVREREDGAQDDVCVPRSDEADDQRMSERATPPLVALPPSTPDINKQEDSNGLDTPLDGTQLKPRAMIWRIWWTGMCRRHSSLGQR